MSIQVAILKVLASHGNGRATLASLKRDLVVLTASGNDWSARLRRLAGRVPSIDIFGSGYVLCDREGWQITPEGRDFLDALEAVTQDNLRDNLKDNLMAGGRGIDETVQAEFSAPERPPGTLIVVGHRFKNRSRSRHDARVSAQPGLPGDGAARGEGVSKQK